MSKKLSFGESKVCWSVTKKIGFSNELGLEGNNYLSFVYVMTLQIIVGSWFLIFLVLKNIRTDKPKLNPAVYNIIITSRDMKVIN